MLDEQGHVLLYCHSPTREDKDRAIDTAKASGLEAALIKRLFEHGKRTSSRKKSRRPI